MFGQHVNTKNNRLEFSFQFSPMTAQITQSIYKHLHLIQADEDLSDKAEAPPIKNLWNGLVRDRYKEPRRNWLKDSIPIRNYIVHMVHLGLRVKILV